MELEWFGWTCVLCWKHGPMVLQSVNPEKIGTVIYRSLSRILQGLGLMSLFGDLFHITFKYLLEIISPIVG